MSRTTATAKIKHKTRDEAEVKEKKTEPRKTPDLAMVKHQAKSINSKQRMKRELNHNDRRKTKKKAENMRKLIASQ